MILTITLNLSIDRVLKAEKFKRGEINRVYVVSSLPGGKGINVSRCIKSLGGKVFATGFKGGRIGEFIEIALLKEGIIPVLFSIKNENRICNIIIEDDGTITEIYEGGPDVSNEEKENFLKFIEGMKSRFTHIVISGSSPVGIERDYYKKIVSVFKGRKVFIDFQGESLIESLKENPYFVKINEREFENTFEERAEKGLKRIAEKNRIKVFTVTLGEKGAFFYFNEKLFRIHSSFKPEVVNPAGAGDSFMGGFVYSDFSGKDVFTCFKFALSASMSNVTLFEGGRINRNIFKKIMETIVIEEV